MFRALVLIVISWFAISGEAAQITCQKDAGALKVVDLFRSTGEVVVEFGTPRPEDSYQLKSVLLNEVASSINTYGERSITFYIDENARDVMGTAHKLEVIANLKESYLEIEFVTPDGQKMIERFSVDECFNFEAMFM